MSLKKMNQNLIISFCSDVPITYSRFQADQISWNDASILS